MPANLLILYSIAVDIIYWLRRDFERAGLPEHIVLMVSAISGYLIEFPRRPLITTENGFIGLAPDFMEWLKQNSPPGGGDDGEELRDWIRNYPTGQTGKA